jgi:hypothetical protein
MAGTADRCGFLRFGAAADGGPLWVAAPADYLVWTPSIAALAEGASEDARAPKGSKSQELWVAGKLSSLARRSLQRLGWPMPRCKVVKLV